jgi:AcrR family transcriptional regulator
MVIFRMKKTKFKRRASARPDEVLDSAMDLFLERGYANTRMDDVARLAGISKGSVYQYFPSKKAIVEGLVERALIPLANKLTAMVEESTGDPRQIITTMVRRFALAASNKSVTAIPKIVIREAIVFPEISEMYSRAVVLPVINGLSLLVQRGIDEGTFHRVNPELTARSIMGPLIGHMVLSEIFEIQPEGGLRFEQLAENHLTILFQGLSIEKVNHHEI